jgi:transposase
MDETLFDLPPTEPAEPAPTPQGTPRIQRPNREQVELRAVDLEGLLAPDHRARLVWAFVEGLDLAPLYARIRALEGGAGRPPIDPAILTALWLYATLEGVGSARALDRLCAEHDAYRWLCGGVSVNYHTLADFRVAHGELFDRLLTESVAALMSEGLVTLNRVAQDGLRVRASAGGRSFRQRDALEQALAEAEVQVRTLRRELDDDPAATSRRVAAARERAARERLDRARRALARLPQLEARRAKPTYGHKQTTKPPHASTSDPEATFMKFADGGVRPAYNVQLATDTASQIVVGLDVVDQIDQSQLGPMVEQLRGRYARAPAEHLVDGGYRNLKQLSWLAECGTTVYMPRSRPRKGVVRDLAQPRYRDTPAMAEWRARMGTPEAQAIYRERAATAECVNAIARHRGLTALRVRGRAKARAVACWIALAHNLFRAATLRAAAAAAA